MCSVWMLQVSPLALGVSSASFQVGKWRKLVATNLESSKFRICLSLLGHDDGWVSVETDECQRLVSATIKFPQRKRKKQATSKKLARNNKTFSPLTAHAHQRILNSLQSYSFFIHRYQTKIKERTSNDSDNSLDSSSITVTDCLQQTVCWLTSSIIFFTVSRWFCQHALSAKAWLGVCSISRPQVFQFEVRASHECSGRDYYEKKLFLQLERWLEERQGKG